MTKPTWYYSRQTGEVEAYGSRPPGRMSIRRIIQTLPAFLKLLPGQTSKPKSLVVIARSESLDPVAVKKKLVELMQLGHTVYLQHIDEAGIPRFTRLTDQWIENESIDWQVVGAAARKKGHLRTHVGVLDQHLRNLRVAGDLLQLEHYDLQSLIEDNFSPHARIMYERDYNVVPEPGIRTLDTCFETPTFQVPSMNPPTRTKVCQDGELDELQNRVHTPLLCFTSTQVICEHFNLGEGWRVHSQYMRGHEFNYTAGFHSAAFHDGHIEALLANKALSMKPVAFRPEHLAGIERLAYVLSGHALPMPDDSIEVKRYGSCNFPMEDLDEEDKEEYEPAELKGTVFYEFTYDMLSKKGRREYDFEKLFAKPKGSPAYLEARAVYLKARDQFRIDEAEYERQMTAYHASEIQYHSPQSQDKLPESAVDDLLRLCPNLRELSLGRVKKNANWPRMARLKTLSIGYYPRLESLLALLKQCPALENLSINSNELSSTAAFPKLEALKNLTVQRGPVAEGRRDHGAILPKLLAAAPNLETLKLGHETKLIVADCPKLMPQLKDLELYDSKGLAEMMKRCPNLERLSLQRVEMEDLPASRLQEMFAQCPRLHHVPVPGHLSERSLPFCQAVLKYVPALSDECRQEIEKKLKDLSDRTLAEEKRQATRRQQREPDSRGFLDVLGEAFGNIGSEASHGDGQYRFKMPDFNRNSGASTSSSSSSSIRRVPATHNQNFDPQSMRSYKPDSTDKSFQYQGNHQNLSQAMVIDQLSQYLTCMKKPVPNNMAEGICNALSHLCAQKTPEEWQGLLNTLRDWNGKTETLTARQYRVFEQVRSFVETYQYQSFASFVKRTLKGHTGRTWLGTSAPAWLQTQKEACILSNPWHAICVQPLAAKRGQTEREYFAYNPSFVEGGVRLKQSDLATFLQQSFGDLNLLCVEGVRKLPRQPVDGPAFLACGGLLTLYAASNAETILNELNQQERPYDVNALQGLFLRNMEGMPAWFCALESGNNSLQLYALRRVADYIATAPLSWWTSMEQSLADVKPSSRDDIIRRLSNLARKHEAQLSLEHRARFEALADLQTALSSMEADRAALQPIHVNPVLPASEDAYLDALFTSDKPSHLINMPNEQSIQGLRFALQAQGKKLGRPVIYIDNPEDLTLSNPFVALQADGKTGVLSKGPGGPVYEQLIACDQPPLIVVNFDNFPRDVIVRFNQLVDKNPNADGVPLLPGTRVVALQNLANSKRYSGSDLSSRIAVRENWPANLALPSKPVLRTHPDSDDAYPLHLFQALDWKERLLGYWAPRGQQMEWIEGELPKALRSGKPISLVNAPEDQKGFAEFWLEACENGFIEHEKQRIDLPANFSLGFRKGYDWAQYASAILSWGDGVDPQAETLNAYAMSEFLTRYLCIEDSKSVIAIDGLLREKYAGQTLVLNISHAMSPNQLAHFIHECTLNNVTLRLNLAKGVSLPAALVNLLPPKNAPLPPLERALFTRLIASSDPDTTRSQLGSEGVISVNVSECEPADLLDSIDGFLDQESCLLNFHNTRGLLPALLEREGHILILKGTFSPELNQALTPYLLKRYNQDGGKRLIILPDHSELGEDLSQIFPCDRHEVSIQEKAEQLDMPPNAPVLNTESLSKLRARERYLKKAGAGANSDHAWRGLSSLPISVPMEDFRPAHSKAITAAVNAERRRAVDEVLAHSPFVVITGLTGVGKSTFVEKELGKDNHVHYGYEAVRAWAADTRPGRKILFPDEANLQGRSWTDFEGLMEDPPFIRIQNEIIYVTKDHVVAFACNPVSYGDKRNMPALFEQHGNAVVFDPMPQEYIYETILKPLLRYQFDKTQAANIAHEFLRVYRFLCERSEYSVLISPRELITMANLTIAHQNTHDASLDVARHYARAIARGLVPEKSLREFDQAFPPLDLLPSDSIMAHTIREPLAPISSSSVPASEPAPVREPFLYTASRLPVASLLEDLLNLRERCYKERNAPDDFLYGGLGGIIMESEPGQGKSEMAKDILLARGYGPDVPGKQVYDIKASLNDEVKVEMWLQALQTGGVVLADEINSAPVQEAIMNAVAMRKTLDNKRPDNPGLLIIGTQNSAAMGGRVKASNAQSRRFINVQLRNYPDSEMLEILVNTGLSSIRAQVLIQVYNEERSKGIPVTFRDLLGRAQDILKAENPDYQIAAEREFPAAQVPDVSPFEDLVQVKPGQQKPPIPAHLQPLYAAIGELRLKGLQMKGLRDQLSKDEGELAVQWADRLESRADAFQADSSPASRETFKTELREAFGQMGTHRNTWYPTLYQIGRSLSTLGVYLLQSLGNGGFFQPTTRRQEMLQQIGEKLDEVPQRGGLNKPSG